MLLTVTEAGLNAEDSALIKGEKLSPIASIVVSDAPIDNPFSATALSGNLLTLKALAIDRLSAGATKIYGEIPPDTEFKVRSVGIVLKDGTLFACANYFPKVMAFIRVWDLVLVFGYYSHASSLPTFVLIMCHLTYR